MWIADSTPPTHKAKSLREYEYLYAYVLESPSSGTEYPDAVIENGKFGSVP